MTDETKLAIDQGRGARAERLLSDELLNETFASLEQAYIDAWRLTDIADVSGREKLFLAINIVGKVRDNLHAVAQNGKLAAVELQNLAEAAERKKKYGTLA